MAEAQGRTVMVQGRIVWGSGDLFKGRQKKDQTTGVLKLDRNGQPAMEYGFGLAVPKTALALTGKDQPGEIWMAIHEEAYTIFPSRQLPPQFAMKYKDGDGIDDRGVPFAQREGYAGHLVFAMTTSIPIKYFRHENGQNIMINEGIKVGDYVQVQLNIRAHAASGTAKAGLYLNPNAVLFLGYGAPIVNTPSGDQIFGTAAPALPPGASATPLAPSNNLLVPQGAPTFAQPGYPPQQYAPPTQSAPPAFNPSMQQAPSMAPPPVAQPHYGVLPAAHQPQMQAPPQQQYAPAPQQPQMQYQQAPAPMAPPQQYAQPQAAPQATGGFPAMPGMPPFPGQR